MYHDFVAGRSIEQGQCCFETYRNVLKKMNISFTGFASKECTKCSVQIQQDAEAHGQVERSPGITKKDVVPAKPTGSTLTMLRRLGKRTGKMLKGSGSQGLFT